MSKPPLIRSLAVGFCATNCFVVADPDSRDAFVIDPGDSADSIAAIVQREDLSVQGIINTHCHADHIMANAELKNRYNCPLLIHELDAPGLTDVQSSLAFLVGLTQPLSPPADRLLQDGEEITLGDLIFRVIHTPGHTPGGICLLTDGTLFAGDTLFAGSIGRTDFPGGSHQQIIESVRSKLFVLPESIVVYPGHGPNTTIGREKAENPFFA